jgi:tRNA-splicing ligase RtcB
MNVVRIGKIDAFMWLDDIEDGAMTQISNLSNCPYAYHHIAVMPDSHQGYGMPIGGVMATEGVIVPNAVGVDIGCGMIAAKTNLYNIDNNLLEAIVEKIRVTVPVGFSWHEKPQEWSGFNVSPDVSIITQEIESAKRQLGTLGGGNHFIEIQKDETGCVWIMIHSGSRNLGKKVADVYHKKAVEFCEKWYSNIPTTDLAFLPLSESVGQEYKNAMGFCVDFAEQNRSKMMMTILNEVDTVIPSIRCDDVIDVAHNYAAMENHFKRNVMVHRKGAVRARLGDRVIIPGSMGTASYICSGLGNPLSFQSCSHGAGRRMGRKEAERTLNLQDEQKKMQGIIHGIKAIENLDEAPGAYKDIDVVMENQKDLVKIETRLMPIASIKG